MTARSAPQVVSSRIRERQTAASTASMPNARPWRRGQAPKPHRGAPKAQGLTAAIAVAGPSPVPSIAPDDPVSLNSTGADVPMCAFATSRIYTSLTGTTQVENDYDREVYNGDLGIVQRIDQEEGELVVTFDGRDVSYGFGELDELVLVYATTIHKSQGSEYPAVVIPLVTQHYMMLARNLLYTGVTRGKRLVVLVGQRKALAIAVRNHGSRRRWAKLREHLTGTQSNQLTISREEH